MSERILLADDHPEFREIVARVLDLDEGSYDVAGDGAEAVRVYEESRPALVVMDFEMPVMDGIDATRQIIAAHPGARVVMLTQHDDRALEQMAIAAGALAFITKRDLPALPGLIRSL